VKRILHHGLASALACALGACASIAPQGPRPAAPAPELAASEVSDSGRMRGVVINRRYRDFFMIDGAKVHRDIELAWDYDRGTAIRRTYDLSGKLLQTEDLPGAEMRLTAVEDERLKELIRTHPTLKHVANEPGVVIWAGGFVMRIPGDRYCDKGTRCIYATLSKDEGFTPIVRAIVDLQRDRVVYPDFDPGTRAKAGIPSMGSK
jgi:hypothetical protein